MTYIVIAFVFSFLIQLVVLRTEAKHIALTGDHVQSQQPKLHKKSVPRIGGIGIYVALLTAAFSRKIFVNDDSANIILESLLFFLPIFFVGLAEDLIKNLSTVFRLSACLITSIITAHVVDVAIIRSDFFLLDNLLSIYCFSLIFTGIAITGLTNSYNLIDGLNGLSSLTSIMTLTALGYVSYKLNSFEILLFTCIVMGAILGFLFFNFPKGLIFLGDNGAYLIGFLISIICIALSKKHQEISPWFFILINAYPIADTLFSIYRRLFKLGCKSIMRADGAHLHTLLYRRCFSSENVDFRLSGNATASIFILPLPTSAILVALIFWQNKIILLASCLIFFITYIYVYMTLVKFRTPYFFKLLVRLSMS